MYGVMRVSLSMRMTLGFHEQDHRMIRFPLVTHDFGLHIHTIPYLPDGPNLSPSSRNLAYLNAHPPL